MKKILLIAVIASLFVGCTRNAVTGRRQLNLVSETQLQAQAVSEYQSFLSTSKVINTTGSRDAEMVKRVGNRVATAITNYYGTQGKADVLAGYQWEFNLVNEPQVNAWCMPGGKVVVYSGLLPVTQNEAALAVVMGHEICHAVAKHGNERMSQGLIAQGIEVVGNIALQNNAKYSNLFNSIYAPGVQIGALLPNGRNQEYEADHFGLLFCAMAGYNPQEAVNFWKRMAAANANTQKPPELLSTHPLDENRIARIEAYMPEALSYYKPIGK
ncbi:MAG: M48 family metallopeptidase [Ferruginibacter sp.]|nr:M48 family metallopeptidase [Ferruginibacter sp.]